MKAIYCRICYSLVQMSEGIRVCTCGNICGKDLDGHRIAVHAIFTDWAVPLSISNAFLNDDHRRAREAVKIANDWDIVKYKLGSKHAESCGIFEKKECKIEMNKRLNNLKIVLITELLKDEIRTDAENMLITPIFKFKNMQKKLEKEDVYSLFNIFTEMRKDYYGRFVKEYSK